ncbi:MULTISPECIES: ComEC/Rec2 family competence protein [Brevibacillus]|uniref:ComEC/Rec2 family competence protein n=1 Tax=Brevibacillus TaxID=55080 RepID=UPI000D0E6649|nr:MULTISPECIES: MBL fold metallo-hydrolase [Brevibacillus]PSJ70794.1 MBL fold metallo-hydrolase [Brevibacillus brevis]RED31142.1 beta-lactamase superfamily II metal-dependent hydrolase [Brevibacillus brevis]TQK63569.1 beta-lactamase superfamily II metal-dependent hydrolase [Brevibacillus sp. AG162]VEF89644.1 ComEC family competence protein [Brevibacillus brevis]GEC89916.1 MBL fold protein [Brevibacillus brevis]
MLWKKAWRWWIVVLSAIFLCACSIDSHLYLQEAAVKIDDPFETETEQEFSGLIVTYLALPHGESTLLRMPGGKTMLIDTGTAEDWPVLSARLAELKITRLDYVVLTNDQPEHMGGYALLSQQVLVDAVILPKLIAPSIRHVVLLRANHKQMEAEQGQVLTLDQEISMEVLLPEEPLFLSPQNNSLVFRLTHGQLRFLFMSAVNEKAEERLLERQNDRLKAEVLKVAGQGSNQGSSQPFLTQVDPQVAIIQTGRSRDQMKDGQTEVMERLGESWAETYVTSHDGSITILSNGKEYRILKQKN